MAGDYSRMTAPSSPISRRNVIVGMTASQIARPADAATTTDAKVVALVEQFTAAVKEMDKSDSWNYVAHLAAIGTAIVNEPALTIAGLALKARIAAFLQASGIWL